MPQSTIFDHFSPRSKMKAPEAPFSPTRTGTGIGSRTGGSQRARFEAHFKSGSPGSPSAAGGSKAAGARSKRETRLMRSSPSPEMQYDSDDDFALDRIMLTQRAEVSGRERKAKRSRRVRGSSEEADEDENEDEEESGSGDEGVPSRGAGSKRPRVVQQDESEEDEGIEVVESPSKSTSEAIGRGGRRKGRRIVVDEANDDSGAEESRNATSTTIRRSLRRPITDIPEDEGPESHQDDESVAIPPTRLTRARNSTRRSGPAAPIVDPDTAQPGPQTSHGRSKAIPQEPGAEPVRRSTRRPPALIVPEPAQTTRTARTADKTNTAAGPSVPPTQRKKGQQTSKDIPRSARSSSQVLLSVEVPPLSAVEKARYSPRFEPVSSSGREPDQGEAGEGKAGNGGDGIAVSSSSMPIEEQGDSQELVAETGVDGIDASQATGIAKRQRTGENHNEADAAPEVSDMGAPAAVRIAGRAVPGPSADRITVKQAPSKADDGEPADEGVNTLDVAESDDEIVVMEVQEKAANGSSAAAGRSSTKPVVAGNKVKTAESSRPDQSTTNNAKSASKPPPKALGAKAAKSTKRPLPRSSSSSSSSASPQPDRVRPGQKGKNAKSATRRKFKDPDASTSSSSSSSSESDVRPAKRAAAPKEPVKKSKTTNKSQQKKAKKQKKKHDPDSSDASSAVTSEEDMVAEIEMDEAERFRTETRLRCKKKETPAQRSMRKLRARRLGIIEVTSSSSTGSSDDSDDDGLVRGLSYDSGDESDYVKARSQRVNRNRAEALAEEKARRAKHAQARAVGKLPDAPLERLDEFTSDSDFIEDDGGVVPDDLLPHQFSLNSTQSPEYKFKVVFHYLLLLVMGGPKTLPLKGELKEYLMPNVHDLRRRLGGLRDGSVRSQIWRTDFVRALEKYPQFDVSAILIRLWQTASRCVVVMAMVALLSEVRLTVRRLSWTMPSPGATPVTSRRACRQSGCRWAGTHTTRTRTSRSIPKTLILTTLTILRTRMTRQITLWVGTATLPPLQHGTAGHDREPKRVLVLFWSLG